MVVLKGKGEKGRKHVSVPGCEKHDYFIEGMGHVTEKFCEVIDCVFNLIAFKQLVK